MSNVISLPKSEANVKSVLWRMEGIKVNNETLLRDGISYHMPRSVKRAIANGRPCEGFNFILKPLKPTMTICNNIKVKQIDAKKMSTKVAAKVKKVTEQRVKKLTDFFRDGQKKEPLIKSVLTSCDGRPVIFTNDKTIPASTSSYIRTDSSISFIHNGNISQASRANPMFDNIVELVKLGKTEEAMKLCNLANSVEVATDGNIVNDSGFLKYDNELLNETVQDYIINNMSKGKEKLQPAFNFLKRCKANPNQESIKQMWRFLRLHSLILLPDGRFIAYKYITPDFKDSYTKTIDNSVGQVVSMPREKVTFDPNQTCSSGLHFCSEKYSYVQNASTVVEVAICPSNVVSIPNDHNDSKGRCCSYVVWKLIRENGQDVAPKTKQEDFFSLS